MTEHLSHGTTVTGADLANALACIEKGQQLAGHQPSAADMEIARRILIGELTAEEALEQAATEFGYVRTPVSGLQSARSQRPAAGDAAVRVRP